MNFFNTLWRKLTNTQALNDCGPIERKILERVYRHAYIAGLSYTENSKCYRLYSTCIRAMSILVICLQIWHVCTRRMNLDRTICTVDVIMIHILEVWKLVNVLINEDIYRKIAKYLESPVLDATTGNRKKIVNNWSNTHDKYLSVLMCLPLCTLVFWNTYPFIDDVDYNLMIEVYVPIEYNTPKRYVITYIIIGLMFNIVSYHVIMSEVILQAYLLSLICQYALLGDCFRNIFNDCAIEFEGVNENKLINNKMFIVKYKKRLRNLIEQHLKMLNITLDLKRVLSGPMLGQLCVNGMLLCFVGYQTKTTMTENPGKLMMSVGYLACIMFSLYLICRWCEEITSQSQKIGEAAYCSGWEVGISKYPGVKASILMVLVRANKPVIFVAGGMYTLSLSSYTNLVNASYSALNILLRMSNDN